MTRHLATLSIAPRNRFLRRSFVLWELFCTAHFSSCGTARTLPTQRASPYLPCSTTATARTRALTARHGLTPYTTHLFVLAHSQGEHCFEAFPYQVMSPLATHRYFWPDRLAGQNTAAHFWKPWRPYFCLPYRLRVIVTPAVYPRLVEFLHFDIQSTGQKSHCVNITF